MGAFDIGFQQGAGAGAGDLARSRQLQDEQRQQNLQRNWSILNDPNSTDDVKQQAGQDIQAQYPTPEHKGTFLSDVLHLHLGHKSAQPIPPPPPSTNPISGAPAMTEQSAKDQLGVPYASAASASTPPTAPASPALKQPLAAVKAAGAAATPQAAIDLWKQYRGPTAIAEDVAETRAKNAAGFAQTLADKNNAARIEEAHIRAHGNVSMQQMDAAAQSLGAEDFASATPEIKMQAMKAVATAKRAPAWKSVTDGNSVYAVNSLDPTERTLLGHKDDLTQRQEFRTVTYPDSSTALVPVTVWSKKGSSTPVMETQDDQGGGAPVSANTPQVPGAASSSASATPTAPSAAPQSPASSPVSSATPQGVPGASTSPSNPGARQPGSQPAGAAVKTAPSRIPSPSMGTPIPMGGKPSELTKSDTSQYTKVAEDANGAELALASIAPLYGPGASQAPTPSSDQELVYAWVRSNVQGAGRMTQAEFQQGAKVGSFGDKVTNWISMAENGTMSPKIQQMLYSDINRGANAKKQAAASLRDRVQQDISRTPVSAKTPSAPGNTPQRPAGVPDNAVWNPQGHNGAGSWQIPK